MIFCLTLHYITHITLRSPPTDRPTDRHPDWVCFSSSIQSAPSAAAAAAAAVAATNTHSQSDDELRSFARPRPPASHSPLAHFARSQTFWTDQTDGRDQRRPPAPSTPHPHPHPQPQQLLSSSAGNFLENLEPSRTRTLEMVYRTVCRTVCLLKFALNTI